MNGFHEPTVKEIYLSIGIMFLELFILNQLFSLGIIDTGLQLIFLLCRACVCSLNC